MPMRACSKCTSAVWDFFKEEAWISAVCCLCGNSVTWEANPNWKEKKKAKPINESVLVCKKNSMVKVEFERNVVKALNKAQRLRSKTVWKN